MEKTEISNKKNKKRERKRSIRHSVKGKVSRISLFGGLLLGLASLFIGLTVYSRILANQHIERAIDIAMGMSYVVNDIVDIEALTDDILSIYHSIPKEEKANTFDQEYLDHYASIREKNDYYMLVEILRFFRDINDVSCLYIVAKEEGDIGVFVADPEEDESLSCPVGFWVQEEKGYIESIINRSDEDNNHVIENDDVYGWICVTGVPLYNKNGEEICYVLVDLSLMDILRGINTFIIWYMIALVVIISIYILIIQRVMKKAVVNPINRVAEAARQYAEDKKSGSGREEHFTDLHIDSGDEIENLAKTMGDMEKDMGEYVDDLMHATQEKERIGTELNVATKIQSDMIPDCFPAFPDRPEFSLYASMHPAREVGGDFYDFFLIDEDHLCILIADVSDKGIPAALFMMSSKIMINYRTREGGTPAEILADVNKELARSNRSKMFVTVWLGILSIRTGKLICSNAGHEFPFIRRKDGVFRIYEDTHGFMIGPVAKARFRDYELQMEPGDAIFVYTDGVLEASNTAGEFFGAERLEEALNRNASDAPREILENVRRNVEQFAEGREQYDDLTMLCLEYRGTS